MKIFELSRYVEPSKAIWRHASKTPTATALDKFKHLEVFTMGILNELLGLRSVRNDFGKPLVSEPKIRKLFLTKLAWNMLVCP